MFVYEQSFQGKRHFQKGMPCQDRCGHCITPNGWVVAAVADGVSASPSSEIGAEIAVSSCLEYFSEFKYSPFLDAEGIQLIIRDAFNYALRRIKESDTPETFIPFSKMTTLQVLIWHEKIGLHWGQAGDGALIIRNEQGAWKRVTFAMKNKEDNNSPITLQDGAGAWKFGSLQVQGLDSVLLTTDGVADVIGDGITDKEISGAVIGHLMSPPDASLNKQTTDSYFRQLFFGMNAGTATADRTDREAITRLNSITDDITVLLISGIQAFVNNQSGLEYPEGNNTGMSASESAVDHYTSGKTAPVTINIPLVQPENNTPEPVRRRKTDKQEPIWPVIEREPVSRPLPGDDKKKKPASESILNRLLDNKVFLWIVILLLAAMLFLVCSRIFAKPKPPTDDNNDTDNPPVITEEISTTESENKEEGTISIEEIPLEGPASGTEGAPEITEDVPTNEDSEGSSSDETKTDTAEPNGGTAGVPEITEDVSTDEDSEGPSSDETKVEEEKTGPLEEKGTENKEEEPKDDEIKMEPNITPDGFFLSTEQVLFD